MTAKEVLEFLADHFLGLIAENIFRTKVPGLDQPVFIEADNGFSTIPDNSGQVMFVEPILAFQFLLESQIPDDCKATNDLLLVVEEADCQANRYLETRGIF